MSSFKKRIKKLGRVALAGAALYGATKTPVVKKPNAIPLGKDHPIDIKDLMVTEKQKADRAKGQLNLELWLDAQKRTDSLKDGGEIVIGKNVDRSLL